MDESLKINLLNWNERVPAHVASPGYAVQRFLEDPEHLSRVVRFDRPRLGDISGLRGVHLQCHIGTDTLSLARLGADMTGLDFSGPALREARRLAERAGARIKYVEAEVYAAMDVLAPGAFDFVYTGIGALCWLPRVRPWARVIAELLRPGGWFFMREGHPVLWSLAERSDDLLVIEHPYFETEAPTVWDEPGTYVETDHVFQSTVTHEWNHGLGEILTALMDSGLQPTMLVEHQSVPWEALPGQMEQDEDSHWRLREGRSRLPLTYTVRAVKPA
ncbi:MAG TPA: class I SAM-dependent methyltransferase [Solirubrobacteraceae bacterium]|nr:class I SAM-dependent methyltransferase [Solirubrobacteraceae bacterium]